MATTMIKVILIIDLFCSAAKLSVAQTSDNIKREEMLAREIIAASRFKEFLNYNNLGMFINTYYGNIEQGPSGITTFIHESSHIYDNIKSAGMKGARYYWSDADQLLEVNVVANYVSSDSILSLLPAYVLDKPLTQTYILCTNNCSSRIYGIYGLLEEFNAYSLEPRSLVDMFDFFDTCVYTKQATFWRGYLKSMYDSWRNFYYFNVFLSLYLKYALTMRIDFYNRLISDPSFRNSFYQIYSKYKNALQQLDFIEKKIRRKADYGSNKKYIYPFLEDFSTIRSLAESDTTTKYLSVLLKH
jgi:hypothetical protein